MPKSWSKHPVPNESGKFVVRLEWNDKKRKFMDLEPPFDKGSKLDRDLDEWEREPDEPGHGPK